MTTVFQLKVQQLNQACLFELSWGRGQQLGTTLNYPDALTRLYQEWQRVYLSFYTSALRGRVEESGSLAAPPVDWHAKLVQAEALLLYEFHHWLRSAELFEIRAVIASAVESINEPDNSVVDLYLTCSPIEIARLPWEAWEIGTEFAATGKIRIAHTAINRRAQTAPQRPRRSRARILAILGDDTGLNFQVDRQAVRSCRIALVEFVGWQPGENVEALKAKICGAIADERGWDGLFFAGHSNETALTGGELAIAPGVSMSISEITRHLTIAKERGLQFAIFNSCSGLSIAAFLINLGLSQVAVMREPIHNTVAQEFLVRFLQSLAKHKDVHDSLLAACQYLKLEKNLTYPSAYLIPSLFCHPEAVKFQIEPTGVRQLLHSWLPTRREAIALSTLMLLSLLPTVQNLLLESRLWVQAIYRDFTAQVPDAALPPVLLVQIDETSIRRSGINSPNPIDRSYLAKLINQLSAMKAKVVGLDYILDRQQPGKDKILALSIRSAVERGTWFVFAAQQNAEGEEVVGAESGIASHDWSLQGYVNAFPWYVELLPANASCSHSCPFAYLLAMAHALNQTPDSPQPRLQSQTNFRAQAIDYLNRESDRNSTAAFLSSHQSRLHPITSFSQAFEQLWLQPIIDFSIPPNQVYRSIAAWQLLPSQKVKLSQIEQQVVIIAPGGYDEAGVGIVSDNFPEPMAIGYWRERLKAQGNSTSSLIGESDSLTTQVFTGAQAQAYTIHHLLTQRLVLPIPDLWMVVVAVLLGKGTVIVLKQRQQRWWVIGLVGATAVYGLAGLQVYISGAILLPWLLPSAAFWICVLPDLSRKKSYAQSQR